MRIKLMSSTKLTQLRHHRLIFGHFSSIVELFIMQQVDLSIFINTVRFDSSWRYRLNFCSFILLFQGKINETCKRKTKIRLQIYKVRSKKTTKNSDFVLRLISMVCTLKLPVEVGQLDSNDQ